MSPSRAASPERRSVHDSYDFRAKLGAGSFATVYAAEQLAGGDTVAVKVQDLRSAESGSKFKGVCTRRQQAFQNEVALLKLSGGSPNVIKVFASYEEGDLGYIVLERCSYSILHALETCPSLTERSIRVYFRQMLQGLSAVHAVSVVHRDVKPDNFLCMASPEVTVKLCDFGLATLLTQSLGEETAVGINGTAPYMAPEMLKRHRYDTKVDMWSFGVIFYALMFGQFPYRGAHPNAHAMKAAIIAGIPEPPFHPSAWLRKQPHRHSDDAVCLAQVLLSRSPESRPTARDAIRDNFFCKVLDPGQASCSLRPMLHAAKRAGLFELRDHATTQCNDTDLRVALYQQRRRSGSPKALAIGKICTLPTGTLLDESTEEDYEARADEDEDSFIPDE